VQEKADYHIHTELCHHASGAMEEYVREALEKGFDEIGFADHAPGAPEYDPDHRMTITQFPDYINDIHQLRDKFADIDIKIGIETDFYPGFEPFLENLLRSGSIDYVIGSVHFIQEESIFHWNRPVTSKNMEIQLIRQYFEEMRQGIRSGLVDVVGHMDLVKWIFPDAGKDIFDAGIEVLESISQEELILELNTSGLRNRPGEFYPCEDLLKITYELGIPVCLGSDAHEPQNVGANFPEAVELLNNIGYRQKQRWKGKIITYLPES
jgi:histidinol-phosphatase (PHP family)